MLIHLQPHRVPILTTMRGISLVQSNEHGTIPILITSKPIWVNHTPGSPNDPRIMGIREVQIFGTTPPIDVELEPRGILSSHGELPAADGSTIIRVISGRRIR